MSVLGFPDVAVFCGGMGVGKDSFGKVYEGLCREHTGDRVVHCSFADALKAEVNELFDAIRKGGSTRVLAECFGCERWQVSRVIELSNGRLFSGERFTAWDRRVEARRILQFWGTDVRRAQCESYWADRLASSVEGFLDDGCRVFVTDARFLNEIEALRVFDARFFLLTLDLETRKRRLLARDGFVPDDGALGHVSETDFSRFDGFDFVLENSGRIEDMLRDCLRCE